MIDNIDVRGLTSAQIRVLQNMVEIFKKTSVSKKPGETTEKITLGAYDLGEIKGTLRREEIYDDLRI